MTATDRRAAALADLSREFVAAFGESLPVHRFGWSAAKTRKGGVKAVGTGPDQGKTLYGKRAQAALSRSEKVAPSATFPDEPGGPSKLPDLADVPTAGKARKSPPAPEPSPAAPAPAAPTDRRTRGGVGVRMNPYQRPRPLAAGDLVPEGMAKAAPPTPAEAAKLDAHQAADSKRWGGRAAGIIRRVTEAVRGLFTLGGLVTGAGLGAKVGGVVAGPLGVAVGTAVGGGLGGLLGKWGGSRVGRRSGVGLARATRPANRMAEAFAEAFAEPLPPDAVATIKARLKELAAAGGYQIPDVPDDVILKAVEMAARDEDAAGVGAAGAAMAGAADAFEEAAGGRRCRGKRLNKFRAAPFKMPYTPMPSYKPRGGVGMFAELAFHAFAAERRDGEEWETNGRKYKRQGGRTVRIAGSANQSQATRIVGDAAAPRADNAAGPAGGAGPGTQGGVGMETQTQEEAAVYGPRETGPMGAVARPVNDARFRRAGDRVLADPGFRRDLTDAFNRMTLYREFEDGVVEIPRLFHELRRRRPGVTLDQFHAALAAAAGRRQIHLMGADSPALAPGKELAMEDGRNLLFYVVPPQGRRLGAEQLAPV